ncbi:MAG: molecular chaperone DnaK [Myxococcota bacterium]
MAEEIVLGIDLGTSYSCVATIKEGKPLIIKNEWGETTHASVVSFLSEDKIIVGNEAKRRIVIDPEHTVYSAKRLIGRFYFSEEVKKAKAICSYEIVEGPNNSVLIKVHGKTYTLPEISAFVLKEMKAIAENELGQEIKKAVITVPAFFNDNQRQATRDAGKIAGLDVLRIINEPTAAALAYGLGRDVNQRVAVYDLGGGTFDVSILEISDGVFEVIATNGDTYLGGDDFDNRIYAHFANILRERTGIDISTDKNAIQKLKSASEKAKIALSSQHETMVSIRNLTRDEEGKTIDFNERLSIVQLSDMTNDLIQRTFIVCDAALSDAGLSVNDIDAVILVGGPTRLSIVRDSVKHYFGKDPIVGINPDTIVAIGAAIQADALAKGSTDATLLDVTPLSLRIGTVGGYTEAIIDKNTPVPIDKTRTFTTSRDYQDKVKIMIYQGEARHTEGNELLGEFEFSGIRKGLRGEVRIEVTFEIDTNGIVNVSARDVDTGARASTTIKLSSGLTERDIAESKESHKKVAIERKRGEIPKDVLEENLPSVIIEDS